MTGDDDEDANATLGKEGKVHLPTGQSQGQEPGRNHHRHHRRHHHNQIQVQMQILQILEMLQKYFVKKKIVVSALYKRFVAETIEAGLTSFTDR